MKQYIGTKIVRAERFVSIEAGEPREGYTVVYADGYRSWSPKDVFDEAYREAEMLSFGLALEALKKGLKLQRAGWNGAGLWLELQRPDAHSKMTLPYIYMSYPVDAKTTPGARVPWLASQTDMLADDWRIVE